MTSWMWMIPMIYLAGAGIKAREAKRKVQAAQRHSAVEALGDGLKGSGNVEAAKEYLKESKKNSK